MNADVIYIRIAPQRQRSAATGPAYGPLGWDFDLSSLQNRIQIKDLEHLYKRYEQRAQIGE